ncbi:MAG TPA: branched-chain amino acid ABC transporter permease [Actinomycetota bacterium]|nr:branched-chain amino acid ABC transporter permease [Actinomycetota bacterium]
MSELLTNAFSVVSLASVFVLIALGLHFTFGLLGLVNLAHGEFLLLGAYIAYAVQEASGSTVAGVVAAPFGAALIGLVVERALLRFFYERPLDSLLATFGLAVIIRQGVQLIYSAVPRQVRDPLRGSFDLFDVNIPRWRLLIVVVDVLLVAGIGALLSRTRFGLRARASVRNPELAETMGIDVGWVRAFVFAIGSGVAGAAGALMAPISTLDPEFGLLFLVNSFLVVILGGVGSLYGLVAGGVVLGCSLALLQFAIPTVLAQIVVLVIAVAGVRLRPFLVERAGLSPARP